MLKNETFLGTLKHCVKVVFLWHDYSRNFTAPKAASVQRSVTMWSVDLQKKKKKKKGFFCLLPLSFIISYKIFLEQRSDNNFFLCASTKKGNESLVFSWNLGRRRRGKNLTDTLEIGVYDGHFPVNAFLPSCPDILPPPLKASVEEATLETGLHP